MAQIDQAFNFDQGQVNEAFDRHAADLELTSLFPKPVTENLKWSQRTGFFRELSTRQSCGFSANGPTVFRSRISNYFLNIELNVSTPITQPKARLLSSFAKAILNNQNNGQALFIEPVDVEIPIGKSMSPADCL